MLRPIVLIVAGGLLAATVNVAAAQDKVTLALNWIPNGNHFGILVARDKGYYRDANLDVNVQRGYGSGDTVKRVSAGAADIGIGDAASVISGRANGLKVKQVASLFDKSADAIFFLANGAIKTPKDLEGHTLGATAGETTLNLLPVFSANAKIENSKINIINMAPSAKYASLVAKSVDSIVGFTNEEPAIQSAAEKTGASVGRFLFSDYGVDYYSIGFVASDETLTKQGEMVRRFLKATMRGYEDVIKNPDEAADIFVRAYPESSRAVALSQWKVAQQHIYTDVTKAHGLGYMDKVKMTKTLELIKGYQKVPDTITPDDIFTADYLK